LTKQSLTELADIYFAPLATELARQQGIIEWGGFGWREISKRKHD
jgi:hypothetical protein